jgi:hypothetical protein
MSKREKQRKRPRLGDLIEVKVPGKGLAYLQYVNFHRDPPGYGYLVRVLRGVFQTRPSSFEELIAAPELWFAFVALRSAIRDGHATIVSTESVPQHAQRWPMFKGYNENIESGKKTWFLWNGSERRKVGELPPEYYDCSMEQVVTLDIVTDRIATGWMPRNEVPPGPPRGLLS